MGTVMVVVMAVVIFAVAFFAGRFSNPGVQVIDEECVARWLLRMEKTERGQAISRIFAVFSQFGQGWMNPSDVLVWVQKMDPVQKDRILYHLVKSAYNGRRTIHRCPSKKRREDPEITFEK